MDRETAVTFAQHASVPAWSRRDFLRHSGSAVLLASAAGVPGLLEACSSSGGGGRPTSGRAVRGGRVVAGIGTEATNFNSAIATSLTANTAASLLMFDGLLTTDAQGDLTPAIASTLPKVSADGTTFTFTLRPGVRWSDGTPLTANDVLFTYNLMFAPEYKEVPSARRSSLEANILSLEAPDSRTFVVRTKQVWAPFLTLHSQYGIMPAHAFTGMSGKQVATADFNTAPAVVSGMFKFVRWDKGQQLVLARNESYYGTKAYVDTYVQRVLTNTATFPDLLRTGEIDVAQVDPTQVDSLRSVGSVALTSYDTTSMPFYAYNLRPERPAGAFLSNKAVRQALLLALDRSQMVKVALNGLGGVPASWIPPGSWAYNPHPSPVYAHDPKKAARMLDEAGWTMGGDGVRAKGGARMELEIDVIGSLQPHVQIAQIMQAQWKDLGVTLDIRTAAASAVVNNYLNARNFDLSMGQVNWPDDPDEGNMFSSTSTGPGGLNAMNYRNLALDQLFAKAVQTVDRARRKALYGQIQNILNEDLPAAPMAVIKSTFAYNKRVHATFSAGNRTWQRGVWVADGK